MNLRCEILKTAIFSCRVVDISFGWLVAFGLLILKVCRDGMSGASGTYGGLNTCINSSGEKTEEKTALKIYA